MTAHTVAEIALAGLILDGLGGLYLAYDLLGGEHGPLRTLTRAATYSLIYGIGFGLVFGVVFGLVTGAGLGTILGLEFTMAAHAGSKLAFRKEAFFGLLRGLALGLGVGFTFGPRLGTAFGLLSAAGLVLTYRLTHAPSRLYHIATRPKLDRRRLYASGARALAVSTAGIASGLILHKGAATILIGVEIGVITGLISSW
ncbi:MAG TPA: hypothetical protein VKV05_13000, partial [Terriglobales bacterium]|nr:hypothetical protein [Terriglobales bacterium]